jgi:4-hydroxybenzoate polyprenyltransferase
MANLAGAIAIMFVLRLPLGEALLRSAFAFLLNALVYLNNDYLDVEVDAQTPDKDARKVAYLQANLGTARALQWGLGVVLLALATQASGLWLALVLGGGICVAYSAWLKHKPALDIAAMAVWGFAMPLCGTPLHSALGLLLAAQLGLMSAVFEAIQVIRDHDADRAAGVRTSAVALGTARTLLLARVLMVGSALYAALVLHPIAGGIAALALLVPLSGSRADAYWTRIKLVYGVAWLWTCGVTFTTGTSGGLWLAVPASATLPLP